MLALALGLNATVFTVMDAVLFRGMPLAKRSDRLVYINMRKPSAPSTVLYADFEAWRGQAQAFEDLAFTAGGPIAFRDGDGHVVDMNVQRVTANTFGLLGVRPALGRDFVAADEAPGAAPVAILSYRFSGAGILVQSLIKVVGADTGVRDTGRIVVAGMLVPSDRYKDPAARLAYFDRLEAQLQRVPGVQQTSVSSSRPVIS